MFDLAIPPYTYCESGAFAVLPHPFNVLSCLAFWAAAWRIWLRRDPEDIDVHMFMALMLTVLGVTGMLWHGWPSPFVQALDILGLYFLMMVVVITVAAGILRWPLWAVMATVSGLVFVSAWLRESGLPWLPQNGGAFLPAFLFMAFAALKVQAVGRNVMVYLLCSAYMLMFGLVFRSADAVLCPYIPVGTHFIWHVCFAVSVTYAVRAYDERMRIRFREGR
jgi:hypothetical protein